MTIKKQETNDVDFLYGLLCGSENKDITKKQIHDERIQEKYGTGEKSI